MSSTSEPRLLILETSGGSGAVAVAEGGVIRGRRLLNQARRHARDLAAAVRDLLSEQAWRPDQVAAVVVSLGPGSYTGLRVGIMSAKAFVYAAGCAVLGIETFAALAGQIAPPADIEVIADAQQEKVYIQRFRAEAGLPSTVSDLRIIAVEGWIAALASGTVVTGPGLRAYSDRLPHGTRTAPVADWDPRAESLLRIALDRWARGERDDLWTLEPLYLRPSSAEAQMRRY